MNGLCTRMKQERLFLLSSANSFGKKQTLFFKEEVKTLKNVEAFAIMVTFLPASFSVLTVVSPIIARIHAKIREKMKADGFAQAKLKMERIPVLLLPFLNQT